LGGGLLPLGVEALVGGDQIGEVRVGGLHEGGAGEAGVQQGLKKIVGASVRVRRSGGVPGRRREACFVGIQLGSGGVEVGVGFWLAIASARAW
jgi:hypothetical protein